MAGPKIYPEPMHEPVGTSPEIYPRTRRWAFLATAILVTFAAAVAVLLRP